MTNRIVLVTGAHGGLGAHVTRAFLDAGAQVVGTSRHIAAADFPDTRFVGMPADLTDPASAAGLVDAIIARFHRIDVLAHVAGGFAGGAPIQETADDVWTDMIDLNLRAA